jgi:O-antigen/teichoic acid export membrane protein
MLKNWSLGKWLAATNFGSIFSSQLFPWILLSYWGSKSVAEMAVITSISRIFAPVMQGIWLLLLPKLVIYSEDFIRFKRVLFRLNISMFITALILVMIGFFYGTWIIEKIYSSSYANIGSIVVFGFILQGISLINIPIDASLNALKRTDLGFRSLLVSVFIAIVIGFPLTWKFGIVGAFFGMIFSTFFGLVSRTFFLYRILR